MNNVIETQGFIRPYKLQNFEIGRIRFYDPQTGEILFTKNQGWLEIDGSYNSDVKSLYFTQEIKRKIKENLKVKHPYVLKDNGHSTSHGRYILYIPITESSIGFKDNGEHIKFSTDEDDRIYHEYEVELKGTTNNNDEFHQVKIKLEVYVRTDIKEFGKEVEKWAKSLKEEQITISNYNLVQLLKKYELKKR